MHYFHSNQSVNTCRIRILALRRILKSVRCLRSMGDIPNGVTVTRRPRGDDLLEKVVIFIFFAYKKYSCRLIQFILNH